MRSLLKYIGSKDIDLNKYDINNYKIYCEPFGGSFNTGIKLIEQGYKGRVIYNDLDSEVANFWMVLKTNPDKLFEECSKLIDIINKYFTDDEKKRTLELYSKSNNKIKRASYEYVYRACKRLRDLSFRRLKQIDKYDLYLQSEMLKQVEINNTSYKDIIEQIDSKDTFLLIDPPYICKDVDNYYRCDASSFNHEELFKLLNTLKSKWILTYNDNEYIREKYKDKEIEEIKRCLIGREYTELIIKN